MSDYEIFLERKSQLGNQSGFEPVWMPDFLFDFQKALVEWAILKGRCGVFADCGLGKSPMQLVWAENIVRKTSKRVLILTPLAVSHQHVKEGEKFGIEVFRSRDGKLSNGIVVTNYERLKHFNPNNFIGIACDESSILKSFDGATKAAVTEFSRKIPYRSLWTATAAPNDYIELGTSAEYLGELGYMDMLNRFFKNDHNNSSTGRHHGNMVKWRFKGHAEQPFWRWIVSWGRALRKPSDLGFLDAKFKLPPLKEIEHVVEVAEVANGYLFTMPAIGLREQREERRATLNQRCEKVAELVNKSKGASVSWCHLNPEGDLLEKLIKNCVQVSGRDSDDEKEEKLEAFTAGKIPKLVTKQKIAGWGLNWQHCHHMTDFPSHSFEQRYQGVRRCWRFGQKQTVTVETVTTEGEKNVVKNYQRKAIAADKMFSSLVREMNQFASINKNVTFNNPEEIPAWLS
jgi:hypothetical protein